MQYRTLGGTGIVASELALGAMISERWATVTTTNPSA
jgi:aryl-alcohol dehydrogenase-like predicted oxidoreductase